jgi:S1-C subfamily serine protease
MRSWTVLLAACALLATPAQGQKPPPLGADPAPMGPSGKPAPSELMPRPEMQRPGPGSSRATALPGKPPPLPPGTGPFGGADGGRRQVSSGTGFVVAPGRLLTNHHVAAGCTEMRVRTSVGGTELVATVAAQDEQRDLALLNVRGQLGAPLIFRSGPEPRRGEGVVTYGFPLAGLLSSGPTLTTGEISALAGLRDNPRQFQISAPVQPGNSGGPLLDMQGQVVGVVVSKLNAQRIAQSTGDIPQNVNFAVKGTEALEFLRRNGVEPRVSAAGGQRNAAEVGELAHPSTVFLRCMR